MSGSSNKKLKLYNNTINSVHNDQITESSTEQLEDITHPNSKVLSNSEQESDQGKI